MRFELDVRCQRARELIDVPPIPLAAIRKAAKSFPTPRPGNRRKGAIAALVAATSIVTVAAAAEIWSGTHVSINQSKQIQIVTDRFTWKKNPTAADMRAAALHADFPVIFPQGLPNGTTPIMLWSAGSSAIVLGYNLPGAWRRSNHLLTVVLTNPQRVASTTINRDAARREYELMLESASVRWIIGHEEVILSKSTMTPTELVHMKSAMLSRLGRIGEMH